MAESRFVAGVTEQGAGEDPTDPAQSVRRPLEVADADLGAAAIRPLALAALDPAEHLGSGRGQAWPARTPSPSDASPATVTGRRHTSKHALVYARRS